MCLFLIKHTQFLIWPLLFNKTIGYMDYAFRLQAKPVEHVDWLLHIRRGSRNFSKGGGIEEEIFERKMFVDTRINACTHKS